jgi:hypothetical protein
MQGIGTLMCYTACNVCTTRKTTGVYLFLYDWLILFMNTNHTSQMLFSHYMLSIFKVFFVYVVLQWFCFSVLNTILTTVASTFMLMGRIRVTAPVRWFIFTQCATKRVKLLWRNTNQSHTCKRCIYEIQRYLLRAVCLVIIWHVNLSMTVLNRPRRVATAL